MLIPSSPRFDRPRFLGGHLIHSLEAESEVQASMAMCRRKQTSRINLQQQANDRDTLADEVVPERSVKENAGKT